MEELIELLKRIESMGMTPCFELTSKKVMERAYDFSRNGDIVTFSMDRHAAIAGDRYIKGTPMTCMRTYAVVYQVDLKTEDISQVESESLKCDFSVADAAENYIYISDSYHGMYGVKCLDGENFEITTPIYSRYTVRSIEEAFEFVRNDLIDMNIIDSLEADLYESYSESEILEIEKKIKNEMINIFEERIKKEIESAWEDAIVDYEG